MRSILVASLAASLAIGSALAIAQTASKPTADTAGSGAAALANADTVIVPVWPKTAVALPDTQEAVATSFTLGAVEGVDPKLISGVTANGYARKVAVQNQSVGQVLVVSVAKGNKEEAIATQGLAAQFDAAKTSQLFPEKSLTVEGSKAALIAALEKLNSDDAKKDDKKTVRDTTTENPVNGTKSSGNDLASSYRTPAPTTIAAKDDPTMTVSSTTSGCNVRVDLTQEKAFVQSKEQTFSDGVLSSESPCSDSEMSYPLKKSYLSCPDVVDLEGKTAWPQYTLYYVDDSAENHTVSECTQDTETPYAIAEDEGACGIYLDFAAGQAVPQSALVYTNRSGTKVQARGCDTSTLTAPIAMTESTSSCSLRHDYTAGLSYELSMWTYVRDGVTYQASSCTDTGRTFAHETVYTDTAGEYVCTPVVNLTTNTVTLQSRRRITIDGVPQFVTECAPDTASQAILATTDGCMDPSKWTHDLEAGVSYGQERFYYLKGGSERVYVTACQTSTATYTHSQTITGYQNHDDQLYAYPLMNVTIMVNGAPYTIVASEVLPGAHQMVYVLNGTVDKKSGTPTYEGCNAYDPTTRTEQWQRPDATIYDKAIGAGTPVGPRNVCSSMLAESKTFRPTSRWASDSSYSCSDSTCHTTSCGTTYGIVNKTVVKNTDTGDVVSTTFAWQNNNAYLYSDPPGSGDGCYSSCSHWTSNGLSSSCLDYLYYSNIVPTW